MRFLRTLLFAPRELFCPRIKCDGCGRQLVWWRLVAWDEKMVNTAYGYEPVEVAFCRRCAW